MIYRSSPRDELVTSIIIPDEPIIQQKPKKKEQNTIINVPQSPKKIPEFTPLSPDYNNEPLLQKERYKAEKLTNFTQKHMIQNYQTLIQQKVHDVQGKLNQNKVLQNIFKNSVGNPYLQSGIEQVANHAVEKVAENLIDQKTKLRRQVPLTKDDLRELQKVDKYRLLKIKNGQIKNKVGNLRTQLQRQYYEKKANFRLPEHENIKQSDYYSIDNPKTKQANQFVHRIQKKRQQQRLKYTQLLIRKNQQQKIRRSLDVQRKQAIAEQRRKRLQQIYQQKQQKRKKQEEQNLRKKEQFKQWSKMYQKQKPLFMRKQEQFIQKQLIPQLEQKFQKINQIKLQNLKKSQQLYQIGSHDQNYMEFKRDDRIRNEAQKEYQRQKLRQHQRQLQKYYKGKYRYIALEEMMNQKEKNQYNPRQLERQKRARQLQYAEEIKQKALQEFRTKQMQPLEKKTFTKRIRNSDGSSGPIEGDEESKMTSYTDPKANGKKNLQFLHELIKEKGVRKDRPYIRILEEKLIYPNYLQQLQEKRKISQSMRQSSGRVHYEDSRIRQKSIEQMLAKQKRLRDEVRRDQIRRKYNSLDFKQDANIQDKELGAVRLKMRLINQLN